MAGPLEWASQASNQIWNPGSCSDSYDDGKASAALDHAIACGSIARGLSDQVATLAAIANQAKQPAEDRFFSVLAGQHVVELKCAADFATQTSHASTAALAPVIAQIQALREIRSRISAATTELNDPKILEKFCPLTLEDNTQNPNYPPGQDQHYNLCKTIIVERAAYRAVLNTIPLANDPSVSDFLDKHSVMSDDKAAAENPEDLAAQIHTAYAGATSELQTARGQLADKIKNRNLDRDTRHQLLSDPRIVTKVVADGGNTSDLKGLACSADGDYGKGADALGQTLLVGGIASTLVGGAVIEVGGAILKGTGTLAEVGRAALSARSVGLITLNAARALEFTAVVANTAATYSQVKDACFMTNLPKVDASSGGQCVGTPDLQKIDQDNCVLSLSLTAAGIVVPAALAARSANFRAAVKVRPEVPIVSVASAASDDASVISRAESLLGRKLTDSEQKALVSAHNIGVGEPGADGTLAALDNYTHAQNIKKGLTLRRAGFSPDETKRLLDEGIAGHPATAPTATPQNTQEVAQRAVALLKRGEQELTTSILYEGHNTRVIDAKLADDLSKMARELEAMPGDHSQYVTIFDQLSDVLNGKLNVRRYGRTKSLGIPERPPSTRPPKSSNLAPWQKVETPSYKQLSSNTYVDATRVTEDAATVSQMIKQPLGKMLLGTPTGQSSAVQRRTFELLVKAPDSNEVRKIEGYTLTRTDTREVRQVITSVYKPAPAAEANYYQRMAILDHTPSIDVKLAKPVEGRNQVTIPARIVYKLEHKHDVPVEGLKEALAKGDVADFHCFGPRSAYCSETVNINNQPFTVIFRKEFNALTLKTTYSSTTSDDQILQDLKELDAANKN